jgi:hypothetical protein
VDQIFARDPVVEKTEAIVAGPPDRRGVRIGGMLCPAFLCAPHDLLQPAGALGDGSSTDRGSNDGEHCNTDKKMRFHGQPFLSFGVGFSLRQLNES